MYAIVDIAGQQFKVEKDQKIFVHRLDSEIGSQVDFNKVLLIDNDSNVVVGTPVIEGAAITAKVLEHLKGDKVIVFKKKRRKGYRVKNGHRQFFTQIEIEAIIETGAKPKTAKKQAAKSAVKEDAAPEVTQEVKAEAAAEVKETKVVADKPKAGTAKETAVKEAAAKEKPVAKKETAAKEKPAAKKEAAPKKTAAPKKAEGTAAAKKAKKADDTDK
jgi:large subunit ribosomal protein L21